MLTNSDKSIEHNFSPISEDKSIRRVVGSSVALTLISRLNFRPFPDFDQPQDQEVDWLTSGYGSSKNTKRSVATQEVNLLSAGLRLSWG